MYEHLGEIDCHRLHKFKPGKPVKMLVTIVNNFGFK